MLWFTRKQHDSTVDRGTEDIRESMLRLLRTSCDTEKSSPHVLRRIRYAEDLQTLWYLRGDLMAALAAASGESTAREQMASITTQFKGLLPGGLSSRPSPLS
jgi:hypothetical protein